MFEPPDGRTGFSHEKLDVYQLSLTFVALAHSVTLRIPRGYGYLGDQLARAAASIPLNTAEGCGLYARAEKARFFRIARGSAAECAAIVDVARCLDILPASDATAMKGLLDRIGAMLTGMIHRMER